MALRGRRARQASWIRGCWASPGASQATTEVSRLELQAKSLPWGKRSAIPGTDGPRGAVQRPAPERLGALPDLDLGALPKGKKGKEKGKGKGKDKGKKEDKGKAAGGDKKRTCYYCQKAGHQKAGCRKRISDLARAEGASE